ncbi:MAG: D-glycerate dehydrogenase [Candidatus Bathyarchaeota archaeon]|nr:D-glycerate dehydrogenase [Candidatus Bathyarchaeota archaeon]
MKPKVLVGYNSDNFPEDVADRLRPLADVVRVSGDYKEQLRDAAVLLASGERVNDDFLAKAPKLRLVSRFGVGYDTVDVDACTRHGVYVCHTPDILSDAVADLTWAFILGWMRRIPEADKYTREEWGKKQKSFPFGWDIGGKTLGFLGFGRIGSEVAKRGKGFGVKMVYYDVVRRQDLEAQYGVTYVTFEELLKTSDIISVHVPLLPSTRGILSTKQFQMMKKTAIVINTSRGPVIDQKALTEALKAKVIAGAALDVFEVEPIPLGEELLMMENVIVAPHMASATWETRRKMAERCAESIKAYLEGKRPPFTVPEQKNVTF